MRKSILVLGVIFSLYGCGGANDGNPNTDTTSTIPVDTNVLNSKAGDTATTFNTNTGTYTRDTLNRKSDVRSSSPTNSGSRVTTKGADSVKQ
jgi:hypothetical protein